MTRRQLKAKARRKAVVRRLRQKRQAERAEARERINSKPAPNRVDF